MIPGQPVQGGGGEYVLFLISGLLPWLAINEGIMRATTSIVENGAMVRRLPFRSELLVFVPNASAVIFELVGLGLFTGFLLYRGISLRGMWLLPLALLFQLMIQVGIGLVLSAVHVFFRDVTQILGFVLSIVFFLSPILYSVEGRFKTIFMWNPMTPLLGLFRSAMLASPLPSPVSFVFLLTAATVIFGGGLFFFRRVQPGLVDLI